MSMSDYDQHFDPDDFPYQLRSTSTYTPITEQDSKLKHELLSKLSETLAAWNALHENIHFDPLPMIIQIAELIEKGTEEFLKRDPDPLDDRHPHRTHPESAFGNLLKILFRNDDFMNKLVISYILGRDNIELSIQSCRVLLGCVPGLDSNVVFSEPDDFVPRLYVWAKDSSNETLQAYSMGLLAAVLEVPDNVTKYRSDNIVLVPIALRRLKELKEKMEEERSSKSYPYTSFAHLVDEESSNSNEASTSTEEVKKKPRSVIKTSDEPPKKRRKTSSKNGLSQTRIPSLSNLCSLENSNSKWDICQPYLIGTHKVYPLSLEMYQRLILQYLGPTGEYQDLLSMTYEGNALDLILYYIDLDKSLDVRLTFDTLKYLTCLLVHRKFALEFVGCGGVQLLLKTKRESLATVGVVTALYYIAYNNDVMEAVCQLGDKIMDELVDFCLWCLEHCHENGRSSAAMFFTHALYYKAILERFDRMDGPRKLYNYLATLSMLQDVASKHSFDLSEEQVYTSTQCIRNATNTFRTYVAAHLYCKLESIRKTVGTKLGGLQFPHALLTDIPADKSMKQLEEYTWECQKVLCDVIRLSNASWRPIEELRKLGVIKTMLAIHILSPDWNMTNRSEMTGAAIEVISVCCCLPKVQLELVETHTHVHTTADGLSVLLQTGRGIQPEETAAVRICALKVMILCLNVDKEIYKKLDHARHRSTDDKKDNSSKKSTRNSCSPARIHLETMWSASRKQDAILMLIDVLHTRTPTTDADLIRTHACTALAGLARCEEVRQLLSKMPLVANNELQALMREPVAEDKKAEHQMFCREVTALLEIVSGKTMHDQVKDLTQEKLHKQWIVENTKINFNEKELLQLMIQYLNQSGYQESAQMLKREADLPDFPGTRANNNGIPATPIKSSETLLEPSTSTSTSAKKSSKPPVFSSPIARSSSMENDDVFATPTSVVRSRTSANKAVLSFPKKYLQSPMKPQKSYPFSGNETKPYRSLDGIISEYLRTQHSRCKNPVTTCPPFSLYYPHRCPDLNTSGMVSTNIARRQMDKDILNPNKRIVSNWLDERFIFSRFRPIKTINEHDETYTTCSFSIDDEHVILGLFSGDVHWINIESGADESVTNCHNSSITHIEPSEDGTMLLTSSAFVRPLSALWRLGHAMELLHIFNEDSTVKFSNSSLDRIIGTFSTKATLYDTESKHALNSFKCGDFDEPRHTKNIASLSPCDRLVFNDGVLWDVRTSGQPLHVFDILKEKTFNGCFHPHGNQVIINTEVFDIRNYRLLHHVPALDQCKIVFNSTGNMMIASMCQDPDAEQNLDTIGSTSFRTFDTSDYSVITTHDMKKPILGLSTSHSDTMVSVVEQHKQLASEYIVGSASQCKIFSIGRHRVAGDDDGEEEEEENEEDEENNRSDSDDSVGVHSDEDDDGSDDEDRSNSDESGEDDMDDYIDMDDDRNSLSVFEALGRLGDLEESDDDYDAESRSRSRSFSTSLSSDSSDSSSGWETASGEGNDEEEQEEGGVQFGNMDRSNSEEPDDSYEPDPQNDIDSRSSTALNPHLRRRNQNSQ